MLEVGGAEAAGRCVKGMGKALSDFTACGGKSYKSRSKEGGKINLQPVSRNTTHFSVKSVFYINAYIHAFCIEVET